jgi:hypothetical protein
MANAEGSMSEDRVSGPGATVGLILALIGIFQLLATRDLTSDAAVREALINLDQDPSFGVVTDAATAAILRRTNA